MPRRAPARRTGPFGEAVPPPAQRRADGKALRTTTPRSSHDGWQPAADRFDPVDVLIESGRTRQKSLLPIRNARMAASPFAFLRGSALVMAHDLATTPASGLTTQLCGDAHISNFGVFASPERRLVFDLNDFDETYEGWFEWDVKRFAASIAVAGRERGLSDAECRSTVHGAVETYCEWVDRYAQMTRLDLWYARLDVDQVIAHFNPVLRRDVGQVARKASEKNHLNALAKLTTVVDGRRQIVPDPPLVERFGGPKLEQRLEALLDQYARTLPADRRSLLQHFRFVDFARKVVGVGSVGTRCWMVLLQGPNGGPLFLQIKEANRAAPDLARANPSPSLHQGQRVVEGQQKLQAVGDVLLGWATDDETGVHYYVRQLWDSKKSVDIPTLRASSFRVYVGTCAWALARAHARTGDPAAMSGYLGTSGAFPTAIAGFAMDYADQTVRDHARLVQALADGRLPAA
ncbi:MAG: DUF2252 family protein [Acidobacteria bacterium]|nr:DUF2252 family protein [Acidobacteriota bacterium]